MKTCSKCGAEKPLTEYSYSKRDGANARCKTCRRAAFKKYESENKAKILASAAVYRAANRDKCNARSTAFRAANKDRIKIYKTQFYAEHKKEYSEYAKRRLSIVGDEMRKRAKRYRENNPDKRNVTRNKYRAARLNAIPVWFEKSAIEWLYLDSATNPEPQHVDHVIPLTSDIVCGLHCLDNLQIIPATINSQKSNKFDQDEQSALQLIITHQKLAA